MRDWTVAITGASGSVYGLRLVSCLLMAGEGVTLVFTKAGEEVTRFETGLVLPDRAEDAAEAVLRHLELDGSLPLRVVDRDDLFAAAASGTAVSAGMIACPASMGFCGAVASGIASDLPRRAADVMLKERRPLVLVTREMPLSLIHLRNLTALTEAGAIVAPASPGFYNMPGSVEDMVDFVVGKVLDLLGVAHDLYPRWGSEDADA